MKNAWSFLFYITSQNGPLMSESVAKLLVDQERTIQVYTDPGFFLPNCQQTRKTLFRYSLIQAFSTHSFQGKILRPASNMKEEKEKTGTKKNFFFLNFFLLQLFLAERGKFGKRDFIFQLGLWVHENPGTPEEGLFPLVLKSFQRKINRNHVTFLYIAVRK